MNDYLLRIGRRRYDYNPHVHGVFLDKLVSEEFWGVQHQWTSCTFHPSVSSEYVAVMGDEDGNIGIVDTRKASLSSEYTVDDDDFLCPSWLVKNFRGHNAVVMDVCFLAADPAKFISVSGDETVKVWDPETSRELFCLNGHTKTVRGLATWRNDPYTFATGGRDGAICLWDIREPPSEACITKGPSEIILDAHLQTNLHADVGLPPKTPTRKKAVPTPHMPNVTSLVYIDDNLLVSGSSTVESGLGVWDLRCTGKMLAKPLRVFKLPGSKLGRGKGIASLCIDRQRFGLYAAATDGSVHEYVLSDLKWKCEADVSSSRMVVPRTNVRRNRAVNSRREFTGWSKNGFYAQIAASPITDHIMCSYGDGMIRIWDTKEASRRVSPSHSLPGHSGEVTSVGWSSTGKYVLAIDDRKPVLWKCYSENSEEKANEDGTRSCTVQRHDKPRYGTSEFLMGSPTSRVSDAARVFASDVVWFTHLFVQMRQTTLKFTNDQQPPPKKKRHPFDRDQEGSSRFDENDDIMCISGGQKNDLRALQNDEIEFSFGLEDEMPANSILEPPKKTERPTNVSNPEFTIKANSDGMYFEKGRTTKKPQYPSQRTDEQPSKPNGFFTAGGAPIDVVVPEYKNTEEVKVKKRQVKVNFPYPALTSSKATKSQYRCPSLNMAIRQELPSQNDYDDKVHQDSQGTADSVSAGSARSAPSTTSQSQTDLKAEPSLKHFDEHLIEMIESEIMALENEISWDDVAGLEDAKKSLREIVVLPFKRPDLFTGIRAPAKGVLLFGPPGTGKTMIGRCVASQCNATFFNISASSLTSKWVGEGEKLVRALFAIARLKLPSVIFIDEIDSLLSSRKDNEHESSRRIKTEFLVQLDGIATSSDERLLILGATNRPQELDEAARRRFAKRLYIALPSAQARQKIVCALIADQKHSIVTEELNKISTITEGYSGADMRQLCADAAMAPIRDIDNSSADFDTISIDDIRPIAFEDFANAAKVVRPTVVEEDLQAYKEWDRKFGCLL
ncbi:hypothetical protein QR680_005633 [Steinernema hermaphroditum]|uniref:Fidgetin-like protein 1 n=1 Tax=Steinernema hermaphroditum TaxID=289476 RepID=A0AA39LW13_9BILA|nr:hypothetical protein QR680_005633 [Steinernema hermaphroditum]